MRFRQGAGALALILVTLAAGCGKAQGPAEAPATAVRVAVVRAGDVFQVTRVQAVLAADHEVHLAPRVPGRLLETMVTVGQRVEAGQPLLRLEGREYEAQLRQAEAVVEVARANLTRLQQGPSTAERELARSAYESAKRDLARGQSLYEAGGISRRELEAAELRLLQAEQQLALAEGGTPEEALAAARAQLRQAEAARDLALMQVEATVITAPWAGYVWYAKNTPGEMLSPSVPAVALVDTDRLHAVVGLTDSLVVRVEAGGELPVWVPAAGLETAGRIVHLPPAADPRTRLFQVRVRVDNPEGLLRPGMFVELGLPESEARGALVIPREALVRAGGRDLVFVVQDGLAAEREVTVGPADQAQVAILAGLSAGEQVVISGQHFLTAGARVRIEDQP